MSNEIIVEVLTTNTHAAKEYRGKTYAKQNAAIYNGGDHPTPFEVNVEVGHEYPPGQYTIDPRSIITDEMRNLKFKSLKLLPLGGNSGKAK